MVLAWTSVSLKKLPICSFVGNLLPSCFGWSKCAGDGGWTSNKSRKAFHCSDVNVVSGASGGRI